MNIRKLSFILTTTVLLMATACNGGFIDPGMIDQPGGGGSFGGGGGGSGAYTVTFDINGGSGTAPSTRRANSGTKITLPGSNGFSRSDYVFNGWNTMSSGVGYSYKAGDSFTVYSNVTFYAMWKIPATISDEENPIPLTENTWSSGNITSESPNKQAWYSFSVTAGTTYYIWWNDNNGYTTSGDGSKTLDIKVDAYYSDGSSVFTGVDSGWSTPQSFNASSTGTVKLKVYPVTNNSTGTFAIVYSTNIAKPAYPCTVIFNINDATGKTISQTVLSGTNITLPGASGFSKTNYTLSGWNTNALGTGTNYNVGASYTVTASTTLYAVWVYSGPATPLTVNTWTNGNISSSTTNGEIWYSFDVTSGSTYYVWWNDSYSGDSTKTLDVYVSAYLNDSSTPISGFSGVDSAWSSAKSFAASSTGTVKLKVYPVSNGRTGTFAIAYNTNSTKPPLPCTVTFDIRGGTGTAPSKTVLTGQSITLPDSTGFSKSGYTLVAWSNSTYGTGTTYLIGASYTVSANITLYALYTRNLPGSGTEADPYQLTLNKLADGFIASTASDAANWYSFSVTEGTTYYIWCNNRTSSDSSLQGASLETRISAYYSSDNSTIFENQNIGYVSNSNAGSFTANSTGTVKIKVFPRTSGDTGSFAVGYNTNSDSNYRPRP